MLPSVIATAQGLHWIHHEPTKERRQGGHKVPRAPLETKEGCMHPWQLQGLPRRAECQEVIPSLSLQDTAVHRHQILIQAIVCRRFTSGESQLLYHRGR
ncbi:unnamed protein product [Chrysoparadoxa australica]